MLVPETSDIGYNGVLLTNSESTTLPYSWEDSPCEILRALQAAPELVQIVESDAKELGLQTRLRDEYAPELVRAALILRDERKRAVKKFTRGAEMWVDRVGLEQSTTEAISQYKTQRFSGAVMDWCSGIGGDAISLARSSAVDSVIAVDRQPINALRTEMNATVYGVSDKIEVWCKDVVNCPPTDALIHIDPDRRAGRTKQRSLRIEDSSPPLDFLLQTIESARGGAIKLSPASNFRDRFPGTEAELISLDGECREATIWFGELAGETEYSATVLPANQTIRGNPLDAYTNVGPLGKFVYDPDPSVVRAGLVDVLCERDGFRRLDDAEEYITSDEFIDSPFARGFEVQAELSNNDKEIRRYFRAHEYGQVEIKCRHVPVLADALRKKLTLKGKAPAAVIVARIAGRTRRLVCHRRS